MKSLFPDSVGSAQDTMEHSLTVRLENFPYITICRKKGRGFPHVIREKAMEKSGGVTNYVTLRSIMGVVFTYRKYSSILMSTGLPMEVKVQHTFWGENTDEPKGEYAL